MTLVNHYKKDSTNFLPFQKKGIVQMIKSPVMVLGDATGLGKTIQVLGAYTYLKSQHPDTRLLFLTDKSTVKQVEKEVHKFMHSLNTLVCYEEEKVRRFEIYEEFLTKGDILIMNYGALRGDVIDPKSLRCSINYDDKPKQKAVKKLKGIYGHLEIKKNGVITYLADTKTIKSKMKGIQGFQPDVFSYKDQEGRLFKTIAWVKYERYQIFVEVENPATGWRTSPYMTSPFPRMMEEARLRGVKIFNAFDEAEAFLDPESSTSAMGRFLTKRGYRNIPITATLSKGELTEVYNIMKCMGVKLCKSDSEFNDKFCVMETNYSAPIIKWGPNKGKRPKVLAGYKDIEGFRKLMEPYYLGRAKKDVAPDLPSFTHKRYWPSECEGVARAYETLYCRSMATKPPTPVNIAQLRIASITPQLIETSLPEDYISSPVQDLINACNHSFEGQKLLVYVDYKTPVDLLQKILPKHLPKEYKNILKITGEIEDRQQVIDTFRDSKDHNILFLNSAGRRGLNLQFVEDFWFLVDPLTGGDYQQICGRIARIGTESKRFTIHKSIILDSVIEDAQVIIQADLRVMKSLAPNTVDEGLIEPEYDKVAHIPDSDEFMLNGFVSRAKKYVGRSLEI